MFPDKYALVVNTEPTVEPVSKETVKEHLRIDAGTIADAITETPSINIASSTGTSTGTGIDVLGYKVVANAVAGAIGAGGTVSIHLEESDDNVTYADVVGSTFTQLSTANQNTVVEKEYSGTKQYVRASASVAGAASIYGVNVLKYAAYSPEDDYIESLITVARQMVEAHIGRRLINSVWNYYLTEFPDDDFIKLPYAPLVSVTSINYTDYEGTISTMSTGDFIVDTKNAPGRIVLESDKSWPSDTLYPSNPIAIRYTAGYGATSTSIPKSIKQAMLLIVGDLYENREDSRDTKFGELKEIPWSARALLRNYKVWM